MSGERKAFEEATSAPREDAMSAPGLPPPPYPLEMHSYSVDSSVAEFVAMVNPVLVTCSVDNTAILSEARWECVANKDGRRASFHIRIYRASACLVLEFQRSSGCSMLFNRSVVTIRSSLEAKLDCGMSRFKRTGDDLVTPPTIGFVVGCFDDIDDFPLGLDFDMSSTSETVTMTDDATVTMTDDETVAATDAETVTEHFSDLCCD